MFKEPHLFADVPGIFAQCRLPASVFSPDCKARGRQRARTLIAAGILAALAVTAAQAGGNGGVNGGDVHSVTGKGSVNGGDPHGASGAGSDQHRSKSRNDGGITTEGRKPGMASGSGA